MVYRKLFLILISLSAPMLYSMERATASPEESTGQLIEAIQQNDLALVTAALAAGEEVNQVLIDDGTSAAHLAILSDNPQIIWTILNNPRTNLHVQDNDGSNLMHAAASMGNVTVMQYLHAHGITINGRDHDDEIALHYAASRGHAAAIDWLIAHGADYNARSATGETPLFIATQSHQLAAVQALINDGADVNIADTHRVSPLSLAITNGFTDIANALLRHAGIRINDTDENGYTPLHMACYNGNISLAIQLLNKGASTTAIDAVKGNTPLHMAALASNWYQVAFILVLKNAGDLSAHNGSGKTAINLLHGRGASVEMLEALVRLQQTVKDARRGDRAALQRALFDAIPRGNIVLIAFVLDTHLVSVNLREPGTAGRTLLHIAAQLGDADVVRTLLENGADALAHGYNPRLRQQLPGDFAPEGSEAQTLLRAAERKQQKHALAVDESTSSDEEMS